MIWSHLSLGLLLLMCSVPETSAKVNPCCYYPCQHKGICIQTEQDQYQCDCTRTGYYGTNCTIPLLWTRIWESLSPSPSFTHFLLTHARWIWKLINATFLRDVLMRNILTSRTNLIPSPPTYNSDHGYISWESYANLSFYTRVLPPVPEDCPTPMGVKGKKELPDPEVLVTSFLLRKEFVPDPQGSNLMFAFFAQHFIHQFFKTSGKMGSAFTSALSHGVDLNQVYGDNPQRQYQLRLFKDGKLKFQMVDGEMYPPSVAETQAFMNYPSSVPQSQQMAVGNELFGLLPGLMMYATIWLREHNRVCDILRAEHPSWKDEQLFQTARLILIGETIKIAMEEYVQHLSGYYLKLKFDPELLFGIPFQYQNRISLEFNHLYHWHPLIPNSFVVGDREYLYKQFLFNASMLLDYGVEALVDAFTRQRAGKIGGINNVNENLRSVAENTLRVSRNLKFQSFNEYRKGFGLKPYISFQELTGENEKAAELESLYGDIDALEFYPGLLLEKSQPDSIFGESILNVGFPLSFKGLMSNPICSPEYWKPSTFGGEVGFNLVKTATLQNLVCLNVKKCPYVSFRVPDLDDKDKESAKRPLPEL